MSYPKLRGRIREKFGTLAAFAEAMEINVSTLHKKLSKVTDWTDVEIVKACDLLDIPLTDAHLYFFVREVEKTQL